MTKSASSIENRNIFYACYDTLFAKKDYAGEVSMVLDLAKLGATGRILELGCGTGNHTQCFARLGYDILGVDPDAGMLAVAQAKLASLEADVAAHITYRHGQIHDVPPQTYDFATALFNVVNYIPDEAGLRSTMREVSRRLKPGASFIFDAWNGSAALIDPPADKVVVAEHGGRRVKVDLTARTDVAAKSTELTYAIEAIERDDPKPDRGKYAVSHFLWSPDLIIESAKAAGLDQISVYPLFDASRQATERDWKLLFHFRKPGGTVS